MVYDAVDEKIPFLCTIDTQYVMLVQNPIPIVLAGSFKK